MKQILVYGDSLSWGLIPGTRKRLEFSMRWPGVFEHALLSKGESLRVTENCLNGRRTVWADPFKPGRCGATGLHQLIEVCSPLSLVILMLGVNDFQAGHSNTASLSAQGSSRLIDLIRSAPIEPGMPVPEILLISPPPLATPRGEIATKFEGANMRCAGLASHLQEVALRQAVYFFDASSVVHCSLLDGVHLDKEQHALLGDAVAEFVSGRIWAY